MSNTPKIYTATDPGAPQLTGQAGSLLAVLDAVLVNGYGAGVNAKAAAGWTIAFSAGNVRAYRNNPLTGTGTYLRVDDAGTVGSARVAHLRAGRNMTGLDTFDDPTPTVAQQASGVTWAKSATLDAVTRDWVIVATDTWFYFFACSANARWVRSEMVPNFAGDLDSPRPDDLYNFYLTVGCTSSYAGASGATMSQALRTDGVATAARSAFGYVMRGVGLTSGAVEASLMNQLGRDVTASAVASDGFAYPYPLDGGLWMQRLLVISGALQPRGWMPCIYGPNHLRPLTDMALEGALAGWPGRSFLVKSFWTNVHNSTVWNGQVLFDITPEDG